MPITDAHERLPKRRRTRSLGPPTPPRITRENRVLDSLRRTGSARLTAAQAVKILPALRPRLEQAFPGKQFVYEQGRLRERLPIPSLTHATTERRAPLTREQELELSVDVLMQREPSFEASARATRPSSALDWFVGPSAATPGFQKGDIFDIGIGLAGVGPFRPIAAGRAAVAGIRGGKAAAKAEFVGPGLVSRGARRTLRIGEKTQQLPAARSRITRHAIERPADAFSRWLMREESKAARAVRRVLPLASAEARVAKAAGREQTIEAGRAAARMSVHTRRLPKEGSPEDVAHFWWAQLPKSHRNSQGLSLVREKQAKELDELVSGRALESITRRQGAVRAQLAQAVDADDRFALIEQLQDLKILASDIPNRIDDLSRSIAQLERVIQKPPKLDERVVESVRALSEDRSAILQAAGVLSPERATAREGIVSGWLDLPPTGEEAFIGHRIGKPRGAQPSLMPVSVGTGRVRLPEGVARENKLVLAKSGRVRSSTQVAAQDWQAAQVYRQATTARHDLAQMGSPFTGRVPEDHMLVNPKGRALPAQWKTDRLPHLLEGDEEAVKEAAEGIIRSFLAEGEDVTRMLDEARKAGVSWEELRVVPKSVVQRYYGQFLPARGATKGGRIYDAAVDFTAASIIFARVGYIPKNITQNLIMSIPHQGPFALVNIPRAAQAMADSELRALLGAEIGFSGATQGLSREFTGLAGVGRKARGVPSKIAGAVGGVADTPLRGSAFLHEAAAEGVISRWSPVLTKADRDALIDLLTNPANRALLNDIRSRAVEAMADFSRLTPAQRKWTRRFLIIPGWLYAGSRYPFHFAATHPARSAALGYAAAGEPYADELGLPQNPPITEAFAEGLPWHLQGIETPWGVERTTSLSPVSTPWEIAGAVAAQSPRTAADYANPLAAAVYNIAGRRATYPGGSYQTSFGESLGQNLERLAPNVQFAEDLISGTGSDRYPEDESRFGRLKRELGVFPIEIERGSLGWKKRIEDRRTALNTDLSRLSYEETPYLAKAWKLQEAFHKTVDQHDDTAEKVRAALRLANRKGFISAKVFRQHVAKVKIQTDGLNELLLGRISDHLFGGTVLTRARGYVNDQLRDKGLEPTE